MTPIGERDAVRRLLQRLGLGPRRGELDAAAAAGFDATLTALTTPGPDAGAAATPAPTFAVVERKPKDPASAQALRQQRTQLVAWWLDRMAATDRPFPERMTWFWHGHFATSIQKVRLAGLLAVQNATQRRLGTGDFRALAQAMTVDPAMLIWLDGGGNRVGRPNENLAREFMELFTLGVGHYTEDDVRAAARALTGWAVDVTNATASLVPRRHDPGPETVLGRSVSDAPSLVDELVALPVSPQFVAGRVWTRFVSDTPPDPATLASARRRVRAGPRHHRAGAGRGVLARVPRPGLGDRPRAGAVAGERAAGARGARVEAAPGAARRGPDRPGPGAVRAAERRRMARGHAVAHHRVGVGAAELRQGARDGRRHLTGRRRARVRPGRRDHRTPRPPHPHPAHRGGAEPARGQPAPARRGGAGVPGKLRERMNALTRRRFLLASGAAAVTAAAAGVGWKDLADRTRSDPLPVGAGVLVLVTLYGGNDGLNTVVPAGDAAYQSARPDLAYAEHEVLDLGEGLGLNPGLAGLKQQWDNGTLAIVRGVSYPKPDHSHFRSMDIWQTASPDHPAGTGWIGRWLDANGRDPLTAVSLEPVLPPMLAGATTAGAALPLRGLALPGGPIGTAFSALGQPSAGESELQAYAARSITDLHRTVATFGKDVDAQQGAARKAGGRKAGAKQAGAQRRGHRRRPRSSPPSRTPRRTRWPPSSTSWRAVSRRGRPRGCTRRASAASTPTPTSAAPSSACSRRSTRPSPDSSRAWRAPSAGAGSC